MPSDSVTAHPPASGLIRVENHRYDADGDDMGGELFIDQSSALWLSQTIEAFLSDRKARREKLGDDDLEVRFAGPDYRPRLGIYSRRSTSAPHGGPRAQSMALELASDLAQQLKSLASA